MRFPLGDAAARWRWRRFTDELTGESMELEIYLPTADQSAAAYSQFRLDDREHADIEGFRRHVAHHWIRDFRGAEDAAGVALTNTPDIRHALVLETPIWAWVQEQIRRGRIWETEGNGDSGSA